MDEKRGEPLEFEDKSHGPDTVPTPNWLKLGTWISAGIMAVVYLFLRHH